MNKTIYYFSMATIILAITLIGYIFYLAFYPFEPVTLNKEPFRVFTKTIKQGEYLQYELDFTKNSNIKPEITYYLVDGSITQLKPTGGVNRPTGRQVRNAEILIPLATKPNRYHLQIDLVYKVSPLQTKYYSWVSEQFEIKNKNQAGIN